MLKNIKVINSVIAMVMLSTVVSLFIAVLGYNNMKSLNNNSSLMYEDALKKIIKTEEIRETFSGIRMNVNRLTIGDFNEDDVKNIDNYNSTINKKINDYEKLSLTKIEKNNLAEFKKDYENYYVQIKKFESGERLYGIDLEKFNQLGNEMQLFLNNLVQHSSNMANSLHNANNDLYLRSTKVFFSAFIIGFILMIFVSFVIISVIKKYMREIILDLDCVAQGDFNIKVDTTLKNEFGKMKESLNITISNVAAMLEAIKASTNVVNLQSQNLLGASDEMSSSTQEINKAVQHVANSANKQSSDLINIKASLDNFADSLDKIALSVNDVNLNIRHIDTMSEDSNSKLKNLSDSINVVSDSFDTVRAKVIQLDRHVEQVNNITNIINSIAEQTDLLALNAAIESARAGEVGKGFSVVAEEIRKLAEKSKSSAKDINLLISDINRESQLVVKTTDLGKGSLNNQTALIEESIKSFTMILQAIDTILPRVEEINKSIENINNDKKLIVSKTMDVSGASEENAASAEEIAASVHQINSASNGVASSAQALSCLTKSMMDNVNRFKL